MTATQPLLAWPGRTNEEWMRSRIDRFSLDTLKAAAPASAKTPATLPRQDDFAGRLTFVDGVLTGVDLDPALKKAGAVFGPLSEALAVVKDHLARGSAAADTLASSTHYTRVEFGAVLVLPNRV
ncbi:MAG TPA: hypothetical protein VMB23_02190, partial [Spirochaetia bacterium]|nr:hypothetical protein [Spirochaetia bacterium]